MSTKEEFHKLIDEIEDENLLKAYLGLIQRLNLNETGKLWDDLSSLEREELMLSYKESLDSINLISHQEVKEQHARWLKK